jgi:hypothetical protein
LTKEELIAMALQAGMKDSLMYEHIKADTETLAAFAKLVAQHEREACAKVCEEQYEYYGNDHVFAKAIRARGDKHDTR